MKRISAILLLLTLFTTSKSQFWIEQQAKLYSVCPVNKENAWTVGLKGVIYYYNNQSWDLVSSPTGNDLLSVHFSDPQHGLAVGRGCILKYENNEWKKDTTIQLGRFEEVSSVFMVDSANAWAVGHDYDGTVYQYANQQWKKIEIPKCDYLYSVYFTAPDNGWAVGDRGSILHYDGKEWELTKSEYSKDLNSVTLINKETGWIVGSDIALKLENGKWVKSQSEIKGSFNSVVAENNNCAWAVGFDGKILQYADDKWTEYTQLPMSGNRINSISFKDGIGWAVCNNGQIIKHTGNEWVYDKSAASGSLDAIAAFNDNTCWALEGYYTETQFYNGKYWKRVTNPFEISKVISRSMFFIDKKNGWIVAQKGKVLRYKNGQWDEFQTGTSEDLNAAFFTDMENGWVCGNKGTMLKFENNAFTPVKSNTDENINSICFTKNGTGWAAADNGVLLRFDKEKGKWKEFEKFDKNDLNCVHFYDDNIGYIVGFYGLILKYNNGKWEQMPNETKETLNSAYFVSAIYGWAVGKNGTILFYDGQKWVPEKRVLIKTESNYLNFNAVSLGWIVGSNGTMLKLETDKDAAAKVIENNMNSLIEQMNNLKNK